MIKIAHLADIHIRPYKYLDEMEYTFDRLFESFKEKKPDLVVISGDTFHSKLTVSNEYFDSGSKFFRRLSDHAPVLVIIGNHDMALNNHNRLDAISPIVNALSGLTKYPVVLSKKSEKISLAHISEKFKNVDFYHFSILDDKAKWATEKDVDDKNINIALYHGTINGIIFDNGWVSRGNKDDIDIFKGFDFGFLGDIHKHQFLDIDRRIAYPGSLRQNNYSEDVEKGYLLWEIEGKDDFEVEHIVLNQKRYFFTLYGNSAKDVQEVGELPEDCRIRFQLTSHVDPVEELKIKAEIEKLYKPHNDVVILPPDEEIEIGNIKVGKLDIVHENIRLPESQIELLREYFKGKNLTDEDMKDLIALDKRYHSVVDVDVVRNVTFDLGVMKWDNMFSYGKGNIIDFRKLNGLVGILGENWIGKSSIMDVLTLGIYNQVFKEGANKAIDYVNRKCKNGSIDIDVFMNGKSHHVSRTFKKKSTKKGEDKCDTEINFTEDGESANGETKPDTNKLIRNKFGTDEDFAFTSLCSQFGLTRFIDARGTKRKEIFAKYFDLDIFDSKYQVANEDYKKLRGKMEGESFSKVKSSLQESEQSLDKLNRLLSELSSSREAFEKSELAIEERIEEERSKIQGSKTFAVSLQDLEIQKNHLLFQVSTTEKDLRELENKIKDFSEKQTKKELQEEHKTLTEQIRSVKHLLEMEEAKLSANKKSIRLLETIPGVDACRTCSLAKKSYQDKEQIPENQENIKVLRETLSDLLRKEKEGRYEERIRNVEEYEKNKGKIEKTKLLLETFTSNLERLTAAIDEQREHEAGALLRRTIEDNISMLQSTKQEIRRELSEIQNKIIKVSADMAVQKERIQNYKENLVKIEEISRKKYIYELYLDAMGKNGISYWIISKKMPIVNKHVNQILAQCVNFKLQVENNEEEKSIKVYISDEKGRRPIELGSGAEKTISSIALRAALWSVCLLPKTSVLILDEAFSYLDNDKYDGVIKLLTVLKSYFKTVIVITHDESLKSVMDDTHYIVKEKGYASCKIS